MRQGNGEIGYHGRRLVCLSRDSWGDDAVVLTKNRARMDLRKQFPRSPRERVAGISMLPRTIDKARAHMENALGEYIYDCNMDKQLFKTLGVDPEEFLTAVRVSSTDMEVYDILIEGRKRPAQDELDKHNQRIDNWQPTTPEGWERYKADLMKIAPGNQKIKSRTDLIDFEEGRLANA